MKGEFIKKSNCLVNRLDIFKLSRFVENILLLSFRHFRKNFKNIKMENGILFPFSGIPEKVEKNCMGKRKKNKS